MKARQSGPGTSSIEQPTVETLRNYPAVRGPVDAALYPELMARVLEHAAGALGGLAKGLESRRALVDETVEQMP